MINEIKMLLGIKILKYLEQQLIIPMIVPMIVTIDFEGMHLNSKCGNFHQSSLSACP